MNPFKSLIQKIPQDRITQSVLTLMTGTALAQVITAVATVIVTWLYEPSDLGIISIYLAFFNFWVALASWRYEGAMLICRDEEESHHLFRVGAFVVVLMAILALPALYALIFVDVLSFSQLPLWAPVVAAISVLGFGLFMMYRSWSLRLRELKAIRRATVLRSAANAGVRISCGLVSIGTLGLFIAEVLGSWAALATVRNEVKKRLGASMPVTWSAKRLGSVALGYRNFPKYEMPSVALNQFAMVLPIPMVGALYGAEAAGWFGVARLLVAIPNTQLGAAISDVFQMELADHYRNEQFEKGRLLFKAMLKKLSIIGLFPLSISLAFAPVAVPLIFGTEWSEMGVIIAIMAPWMYSAFVVSSLSRLLSVLRAQKYKLYYDSVALLMIVVTYFAAKTLTLDLYIYLSIVSLGFVFCYSVYLFILIRVVQLRLG